MSKNVKRIVWLAVLVLAAALVGWGCTLLSETVSACVVCTLVGMAVGGAVALLGLKWWMRTEGYVIGRPIPIVSADADDD